MIRKKRRARNPRPWPMTVVALLLLLQGLGGLGIGYFQLTQVSHIFEQGFDFLTLFDTVFVVVIVSIYLVFMLFISLFAIVVNLRRWENAWRWAMAVQGFALGLSVFLYFDQQDFYVISNFILMAYAVGMVIYLMLPGVQAAFLPPVMDRSDGGAT
jgi:hypothetical protein